MRLSDFRKVWCIDFEFGAGPGDLPEPRCLVAHEFFSGELHRLWLDGGSSHGPPFSLGGGELVVAFLASAEFGCFLKLGWPFEGRVLDLFVEFRCLTNGMTLPAGKGLLGALTYYGLGHIDAVEKESMRELALRGGPYSENEKQQLLDYCQSDVDALIALLPEMAPGLDLPRALVRGEYTKAVAWMEHVGIPMDVGMLGRLDRYWPEIQTRLIKRVDCKYQVYEGTTFKRDRFTEYLRRQRIPWPLLPSGSPDMKEATFKMMAKAFPKLAPLWELRKSLGQMRLKKFTVGSDGRNRGMLSPFSSKTGRNQPSTSKFIFGASKWMRGLIKPPPGWGLAYIDWAQQEFGIAAALSGDSKMMEAYLSGDPYLGFAKLAGAVPQDATKESHPKERTQYKGTMLAVQYGMEAQTLSFGLDCPVDEARHLLRMHRETFRTFWRWSEGCVDYALLHRRLWTTFGWRLHLGIENNPRSLANFPMQANGAEMLRLACVYLMKAGIRICAPVHDALLIEAPLDSLEETVAEARRLMAKASRVVLEGFELGSDFQLVKPPDRYCDEDGGREFWNLVVSILEELEAGVTSAVLQSNLRSIEGQPPQYCGPGSIL